MSTVEIALNYTIRPMSGADIPPLVDFYNALEAAEPTGETYSVAEYQQAYDGPDSKHYTRLMAHLGNEDGSEGKVVGYGLVYKPDNDDASWSRLHVLPEYRGQGLGTAIYRQLEQLVSSNGSTAWRVSPHQSYRLGIEFWQRRGFVIDRYSWTMQLPAGAAVPEVQIPAGFTMRNFVPRQDDEALWRVSNESFAEHHWHHQTTLEERVYWTKQPGFLPSDITFACNAHGQVIGYCWAGISEDEIARRGIEVGWIHDLGVIPAYQRHGLGRALLLTGIHYLRQRVQVVELGVEGKNAKALPLYESVGFERVSGQVNMEKRLDGGH
jgi:mycothiol synthase